MRKKQGLVYFPSLKDEAIEISTQKEYDVDALHHKRDINKTHERAIDLQKQMKETTHIVSLQRKTKRQIIIHSSCFGDKERPKACQTRNAHKENIKKH
jgi:hypothetical protein